MRQKSRQRVLKTALKYAVVNKETKKVSICRYKTQVASLINVSTRTLDRQIPYENDNFIVYLISNVVS